MAFAACFPESHPPAVLMPESFRDACSFGAARPGRANSPAGFTCKTGAAILLTKPHRSTVAGRGAAGRSRPGGPPRQCSADRAAVVAPDRDHGGAGRGIAPSGSGCCPSRPDAGCRRRASCGRRSRRSRSPRTPWGRRGSGGSRRWRGRRPASCCCPGPRSRPRWSTCRRSGSRDAPGCRRRGRRAS